MEAYLTFDYELFGNGRGSINNDLVRPTEKLLKFFRRQKIKVIFFIEGLEFSRLEKSGINVDSVRNQVRQMITEGHEVALHIHPQWLVDEKDILKRNLDLTKWSAARVGNESSEIYVGLRESLAFIQSCLDDDYSVKRFRAGGYHACPSLCLGKVLSNMGIKIDSSIVPGMFKIEGLDIVDYRNVVFDTSYKCKIADFRVRDHSSEFVEEPISSIKGLRVLSASLSSVLIRFRGIAKVNFNRAERNTVFPVDIGMFNPIFFLYFLMCNRGKDIRLISHPKTLVSMSALKMNIWILKIWMRISSN